MAFIDDYSKFPYECRDRSVWYYIVDWDNKIETAFDFVAEKKELINVLKLIIDNNQTQFTLHGVWHGQYRTDIFNLSIQYTYDKIKDLYK